MSRVLLLICLAFALALTACSTDNGADEPGATATSGGTSGGTTGSTTDNATNPTTTDSGGGLPNGEACETADECAGSYCYSTYADPGGVSDTQCFSECIGQGVFELWCHQDADCCEGTCANDGYCVN